MAGQIANAAQAMQEQKKEITLLERIQNFNNTTRQHLKALPAITKAAGETAEFSVPKVRLTARIFAMVEATLTATHASSSTYTAATFAPYTLVNRVRVEANNGYNPWQLTGLGLYLHNLLKPWSASTVVSATSGRGRTVQGLTASSGGTANTVRFIMELPLTTNQRDPYGLILTQNQETVVNVSIDLATKEEIAPTASGYTFALGNITVTPLVETFAIPPVAEAWPDLSIIKLVKEHNEATLNANSPATIKLPTGQTYRKLIILLRQTADSVGLTDAQISGNFEISANQSDIPYTVNPKILAMLNQSDYGTTLPQGVWVFDLTNQGIVNLGGARDYIDTERLNEFWLTLTPTAAASAKIVYETLSRLQ